MMTIDNSISRNRGLATQNTHSAAASVKKQFIVLANSVKKGHGAFRCIAGREVVDEIDGDWIVDDWIRPVSSSALNEGALSAKHFTFEDGSQVQPLDVVECDCIRATGNKAQPENWLLDEANAWRKVGQIAGESLSGLLDETGHLWLQPSEKTDRISPSFLPLQPLHQSLALIRITNGRLHAKGKGFRLYFSHHSIPYDLTVTDPRISADLVQRQGVVVDNAIACISLTQPFSGFYQPTPYHYKLVATLFWQCP